MASWPVTQLSLSEGATGTWIQTDWGRACDLGEVEGEWRGEKGNCVT